MWHLTLRWNGRAMRRRGSWPAVHHDVRTQGASVKVKRIVSNVATSDVDKASAFYEEILGLKVLMDLGWIRTYGSRGYVD